VIPEARLKQLLQPYLFRPVTFVKLLEVQQAITQLYVEQGYFTSGAYIPPQTINNRTIKIEIIEGKIEEIEIYGLKQLRREYVRSRLAIATKALLNQEKLLNALQLLQLNPLIESISAELSKGINPGESFLEVKIEEADSFSTELNLDNYRTPSVGSFSRQISIGEDNLLGFGDRFNVSYVINEGSDSLEDLSYVIPLGAYNGEVRLAYSLSNNQIISEPFQDLDLASENDYYEATYRQPLYQTPQDITIGVTFRRQNSQLLLMDRGFPFLTRGSDNQGKTQIPTFVCFKNIAIAAMSMYLQFVLSLVLVLMLLMPQLIVIMYLIVSF
jgi:hemolysin activation/secretion protein